MTEAGKLYICATPIGNLEDITLRVLRILKEVDLIAAEDTRRTAQLMNYYEIKNSLTSYHEHNEKKKAEELVEQLKAGNDIALVSDAGMPGISDPGAEIIKRAIAEELEVIPVPGTTAAIAALVASGMDTDRFVFEGFLPRKGKEREERLQELQKERRTIILYESPNRTKDTLEELAPLLKGRKVALVRELTKVHEEKIYGKVEDVLKKIAGQDLKGEIVLILEGNNIERETEGWEEMSVFEHLQLLLNNGFTKKEAIKEVSRIRELPKSEVYKEAIRVNYVDRDYKV